MPETLYTYAQVLFLPTFVQILIFTQFLFYKTLKNILEKYSLWTSCFKLLQKIDLYKMQKKLSKYVN